MLEDLKEKVCRANLLLKEFNLITLTWGNVSQFDREKGIIAIKPSGVRYDELTKDKIVLIDLDGNIVEGDLNPSSDTKTHLVLYTNFNNIKGIVHTHSVFATSWAQANRDIKPYGTTHADYYYGPVPCTRRMNSVEINGDYELETGKVIVKTFEDRKINCEETPGVIVANHGPFTWGKDCFDAVNNAVVLEELAKMAIYTEQINYSCGEMDTSLKDKHYFRKHGANSYYGQKKVANG